MTTFETFTRDSRESGSRIAAVAANLFSIAVARIRIWQNRRQVARLLAFDQHMLSDIGLTQGDVVAALSARSDEDASLRLSMLSLERRYGNRAQARDRIAHASELKAASELKVTARRRATR